MTRVIHTGDTHLGYRQYHSPERREDFLRAFDQVVEDAIAEDVDAVIHAGDLFHDRRPDLDALHGTISILRKLRDADVPFLAIVGNHEGTRGRQWLDLFEMLGLATRLGDSPEVVGETAFYGLDHVPKSKREELDYQFEPHDQPHSALVSHGLFQPFDLGDWDAEEVLTEANVEFDAMLLGDNHKPGTKEVADTWVTYCGSTERCSADEREERGYNIVEFDGETAITRRGLDATRDFEFVEADLGEGEGIELVREKLYERDLADAVVIVEIDGEGEDVTPARVEETALEEGALVARVNDRRERDADDDGEIEVSFADPDEAVRERVRDLGLSEAARDIDETVRASKLADSNVRDAVEDRVRELIEDGDLAAFESAPDEERDGSDEDATVADGPEDESPSADETDVTEERAPDPDDPEAVQAVAEAAASATTEANSSAGIEASATDRTDTEGTATAEAEETATTPPGENGADDSAETTTAESETRTDDAETTTDDAEASDTDPDAEATDGTLEEYL